MCQKLIKFIPMTLLATIGVASLCSGTVQAQTQADATGQQSLVNQILGTQTDANVGLGVGMDQRYMGARDYRFEVLPTFDISRGIFFADAIRGAGLQYQSASGFYVSQTFNYDLGRDDESNFFRPGSDNLRGMGDVKGTVTSTLTLSQQITSWLSINALAEFGLDGHQRGNQYQFGLESSALKTSVDAITLDFDVKLGDGQYNQTYFGVTPAQSASSGFDRYSPGSGIYAYAFTATWDHTLDKHWSTEVVLSATRYTNKVADSPIVQGKTGVSAFTFVKYAF